MTTAVHRAETVGYHVWNPTTGSIVETFPTATDEAVEADIAAAHAAFLDWSARSIDDRGRAIEYAGHLLAERKEDLARIATQEMGKGLSEARSEVELCKGIFDYFAREAAGLTEGRVLEAPAGDRAVVEKLPIGPVLGIMPWNYPYYQVLRFAVPNLMLGNTVIIKPAESCPRSALALQAIFDDAGIPSGAYRTLFATHDHIESMVEDERVRGVSITGSERAGKAVGVLAAKNLKKVVLELGGSDAYLVLDTANVRAAARTAWRTRLSNMGQACNSNKRIIVLDSIFDEFVNCLVEFATELQPGDPLLEVPGTYNPMASASGAATIDAQVRDAVEKGARLCAGGTLLGPESAYFAPAVLTDVTTGMRAAREELFGPVAVVYRASNEKEAVEIANDSEYGLGGAVFSQDQERALRVARQLEAGMTHVNTAAAVGAQLPFGGVKKSGSGRELGPEGMDEFANKRLLYVAG